MKSRGRDGWGKRNSSLCRLHFQALVANHDDGGSPEHSPGGLVPGHLGGHVHVELPLLLPLSDARLPGQHGLKVGNLGHEQDDGAEPDPRLSDQVTVDHLDINGLLGQCKQYRYKAET